MCLLLSPAPPVATWLEPPASRGSGLYAIFSKVSNSRKEVGSAERNIEHSDCLPGGNHLSLYRPAIRLRSGSVRGQGSFHTPVLGVTASLGEGYGNSCLVGAGILAASLWLRPLKRARRDQPERQP